MPPDTIVGVRGLQVLDSRGNPTIEVRVTTKAAAGTATAPAGASKGAFEAFELRDGGKRFGGLGVSKAVANVNGPIAKTLVGMRASQQRDLDAALVKLDATPNLRRLGANATVATSIACAKAAAASVAAATYDYLAAGAARVLPVPFSNLINGGAHAGNDLVFQEFMIAPIGVRSFSEAIEAILDCRNSLREKLRAKYGRSSVNVGDEGGFAPPIESCVAAFDLLQTSVENAGWGGKVFLACDLAATRFFVRGKAVVDGKKYSAPKFIDYLVSICKQFGIVSVEDPFAENDFAGFAQFTGRQPSLQVVADDLVVTNIRRLRLAAKTKAANAVLVKPNQAGTLSAALEAANFAYDLGWGVMCSHRSGETEDPFIAELVFALGCGQLKAGAPCRGERTAKYNELLRIEAALGKKARYAGKNFRRPVKKLGVRLGGR